MAAPGQGTTIEAALPIVQQQGLNTNKAVNFSSNFTVDTSGIPTMGATANIATLNITTAAASTGGTGSTGPAILAQVGAAAGGPTTQSQTGWLKIKIAGTQVYIPSFT